jgi:nicotinamide-nucleotide amidase
MKIEERVGELLRNRGLSLSIAESCTAGYLGYLITNVPGSSDYFNGGVIVYSDRFKERFLSVPKDILKKFGAVSAETAELMAEEIRKKGGADIGLATTGIAGPDGGNDIKPVGLVYIAMATEKGTESKAFHFSGDRKAVRSKSARKALSIVRDYLKKL